MKILLSELSTVLGIPVTGNDLPTEISTPITDSRVAVDPRHALFFALTTSSNDGHRYIRDLYRRGVRSFVVSESMLETTGVQSDCSYLVAPENCSVLELLQKSASYIRSLVSCPVIAITGSRGKTVLKEMLAESMPHLRVVTSPRSWNSQIGVPLSLWKLDRDTQLGIFEAGISRHGEMERLQEMIRPTIGIFTSLTDEHSRDFESNEQKCAEKCKLFVDCETVIYIKGDKIVEDAINKIGRGKKVIGVDSYENIVETVREILGYNYNDDIPSQRVSTRIDITDGEEGNTFAYDHYSNDLDGIETALDIVVRRTAPGRPITLIIGDLSTRGMDAETAYRKLEELITRHRVDRVVGIGEEISHHLKNFNQSVKIETAKSSDEFITRFNSYDFPDSVILIKGTPGNGYERIKSWLEDSRHDTCLEVNLDALVNNYNYYRSLINRSTGLVAMVKADAYGTGAIEVARTLQSQGADYLAVAVVEEGLTLRRAGITMPIMVLNPITSNYSSLFERHLEPTIFSLRELEALSKFVPQNLTSPYPVHIKLDTGMHRFGLSEDDLPHFVEAIQRHPEFKIASVFSHLATADTPLMDNYTDYQLNNFERMSRYIIEHTDYAVKRHILNTAGIMRYPTHQYDMVRLGIGLYGITPLDEPNQHLRPVATLTTTISALQHRYKGETIGYSRKGVITKESTIATIPIGYADGLNRHLGNGRCGMMVNGTKCPTIGNICMDISMIDVTKANAHEGDKVEIFGNQIPINEVARALDTIPYEVLTSIAPRVKRIYYRE